MCRPRDDLDAAAERSFERYVRELHEEIERILGGEGRAAPSPRTNTAPSSP